MLKAGSLVFSPPDGPVNLRDWSRWWEFRFRADWRHPNGPGSSIKGLELGRKGTIAVNDNMQSSIPTIFAGGDIVRGGATVILAMGDGRKAAAAMNEQLKK